MKTINIAFKHLEACRQAVITFAKAKNIQIPFSGPFRLDRKDFSSTPWPFAGLPVVYLALSDNGKGLYAGYSYNSTGQNNYFTSAEDGHGIVKKDWPDGNPDYLEFYCLHDNAVGKNEEPYHGWMCDLRESLNSIIYAKQSEPEPAWSSVAALLRSVNLPNHYPWMIDEPEGEIILSCRTALINAQDTEVDVETDKYLQIVTDDEWSIILRAVIRSRTDSTQFIPLEHSCKDLSLISRLPIYADKKIKPHRLAMNILQHLNLKRTC